MSLVIAMHGGFGSANNIQNQSQLSLKADTANFIVVYPEGVQGGALNIRTWNAGWCCGYASNNNIDDVGFIDQLIDTMLARYNIDSTRIYATGMSNGGFMSYRLACELSHRIAAIAPVAASMSVTSCSPVRSVPIISFHSYQDSNVPYEGGVGTGPSNHYNAPQDSVIDAWAQMNTCQSLRDTIHQGSDFTEIHWMDCGCSSEIIQLVTEDGGHSWPGGNSTVVGDPTSQVVDANYRMWEFFQEHSLECPSTASIPDNTRNSTFPHPNPVESTLIIPEFYIGQPAAITDDLGRVYWTGQLTNQLNLNHLQQGRYYLVLQNMVFPLVKR